MDFFLRIIIDILIFLLGFLIANRLNIGRDRRKEFNELSMQLFIDLNKHIDIGESAIHADTSSWRLIAPYIFICRRFFFRKAVSRYEKAKQNISTYNVETGVVVFDESKVKHHIIHAKKLLKYLKRR